MNPSKRAKKSGSGLSLICVWTNDELLASLQESIKNQSCPLELIALDNRTARFPSAIAAFRAGIEVARYSNYMFLHQDIEFLDDETLLRFLRRMNEQPMAIYGVAGTSGYDGKDGIVSSIIEGMSMKRYETAGKDVQEVACLDECCFALNECVLERIDFDEAVCPGWHFYAVDLSLEAHMHDIPCYVLRTNVWHKSSGTLDSAYRKNQAAIERKYRHSFKSIRTTCDWFPTGAIDYRMYMLKRRLRDLKRRIRSLI